MNTKLILTFIALWLRAAISGSPVFAQGDTPITYQGQLWNNGSPANGLYDLTFTFYTNSSGGMALGAVTNNSVAVTNGLFSTEINGNPLIGDFTNPPMPWPFPSWLEVGVATNGAGVFTTLTQRQQFTFVPLAISALNAGTATVATSATNFSGSVSGDVSGTQGATVVASVGGQSAANIADGVLAANSATNSNVPGTIIARDSSGNFSAGSVSLGGSLYLPFPAAIYSGGSPILVEEGNFFAGLNAGNGANTGSHDVGIGDNALASGPSTGQDNTAIGEDALRNNTSGQNNTANGYEALSHNNTGSFNTADGSQSLNGNDNGSDNVADGYEALWQNQIGSFNTAVGFEAFNNSLRESNSVAIGYQAFYKGGDGPNNVGVGYQALYNNSKGSGNVADGYQALYDNDTGNTNIALGCLAGYNIHQGSYNIDIGNEGLSTDVKTIRIGDTQTNTYIAGAIQNPVVGGSLTLNGQLNLPDMLFVGPDTVYSGTALLLYADENGNFFTGANAGNLATLGFGGDRNTADGANALHANTSGYQTTAVGDGSLYLNNVGVNNTANGYDALLANTSGSYNISLGFEAGFNLTTGNNNIDIGNPGVAAESNIIRIGVDGTQTACYLAGTVYANDTFVSSSDRNVKAGFERVDTKAVLERVAAMPITRWHYTNDVATPHLGPMAQDFYSAFGVGPDDKHITTVDEEGVALAAIQGLNQKLEATEQSAKDKDGEIQELRQRLETLEKIVLTQKRN